MIQNLPVLPKVSVIIPFYGIDRQGLDALHLCLQSLEGQTYENFEVLVVSNGPQTIPVNTENRFNRFIFMHRSAISSYEARNFGIRMATGNLLAFTDSDCIAASEWLTQMVLLYQKDPELGFVGGGVKLYSRSGTFNSVELYEQMFHFRQEYYVKSLHFGATANLLVPTQILKKIGLFNENLKSGGDLEWGRRVFRANLRSYYSDEAFVNHPTRGSLKALVSKEQRVIGGLSDIYKANHSYWRVKNGVEACVELLKIPYKMVQFARRKGINASVFLIIIYSQFWKTIEWLRLMLGAPSRRN